MNLSEQYIPSQTFRQYVMGYTEKGAPVFMPIAGAKQIEPNDYENVDLRELSGEETQQIIDQYDNLQETREGYLLGQNVIALRVIRRGAARGNEGLQQMLDEDDWTFNT